MPALNKERILAEFKEIVALPSHGLRERQVCDLLTAKLRALGFATKEDEAGVALGGDCGNLWAELPASLGYENAPKLLLTAHMDTVEPSSGATVVEKDGVLYSDGTTTLGGDDKAGVVAILEGVRMILEQGLPHGPVQLLFCICEEGGVNGSRCMNKAWLNADAAYALDGEGPPGTVEIGAPGQYKYKIDVLGKKAHGGIEPEKGINAIMIAAKALAAVKHYGRIDEETTCNIGLIAGGVATNVVPDLVTIQGDARSRNDAKLIALKDELVDTIVSAAEKFGGRTKVTVEHKYAPFSVAEDSKTVALVKKACALCGLTAVCRLTGGGSDANFINAYGVPCVILGTGMSNVHTTEEFLRKEDLENSCLLVYSLLRAAVL